MPLPFRDRRDDRASPLLIYALPPWSAIPLTLGPTLRTEPTTGFWQSLAPDMPPGIADVPPFATTYPVRLGDGRVLVLPLRALPDGQHAVASLIANQASHTVLEALAANMAALARPGEADALVALPTLGLALAPRVAHLLALERIVPLGTSRKFWYEDQLSQPLASLTSPGGGKHLYIDPNLVPLVAGKRIWLLDDAISTGTSIAAAVSLLSRLGANVVAVLVAMKQTRRWEAPLAALDPALPQHVRAVFGCPLFHAAADGWHPVPDTLPAVP